MIEVNNISKAFEGKVIIDDISAQFRPGICNLIIGTSGSGKTVLTKCIVDLIAADKGKIFFDGEELHSMSKEERKELRNNIGMLFQGNANSCQRLTALSSCLMIALSFRAPLKESDNEVWCSHVIVPHGRDCDNRNVPRSCLCQRDR